MRVHVPATMSIIMKLRIKVSFFMNDQLCDAVSSRALLFTTAHRQGQIIQRASIRSPNSSPCERKFVGSYDNKPQYKLTNSWLEQFLPPDSWRGD